MSAVQKITGAEVDIDKAQLILDAFGGNSLATLK